VAALIPGPRNAITAISVFKVGICVHSAKGFFFFFFFFRELPPSGPVRGFKIDSDRVLKIDFEWWGPGLGGTIPLRTKG
jgi:hypothetical protein